MNAKFELMRRGRAKVDAIAKNVDVKWLTPSANSDDVGNEGHGPSCQEGAYQHQKQWFHYLT